MSFTSMESLENRCFLSSTATLSQIFAPVTDNAPPEITVAPARASVEAPAAAMARTARRITYSAPITITHGGTYSGNWQSLNPNVPAVTVDTSEPVIIQNSNIRSRGTCIQMYTDAGNLTVRNVTAVGLNPNKKGAYVGRFVDVEGFVNIDIENNSLTSTSGIYLYNYVGNHTAKQTIRVLRNTALNIDGRVSNGAGGWMKGPPNPDYFKQFFQSNANHGLVGAEIAWNQIVNQQGKSRVEENINIHDTTGTRKSPFRIHDNYIQGAFPNDAIDARNYTGGGIMLSDNGSSFIQAYNNQLIATGHIGATITSGHDNSLYNNRIVSSGLYSNGTRKPFSNVGLYIWNFNSEPTFVRNTAYGNITGWVNAAGDRNDYWEASGTFTKNREWPGTITLATETRELQYWQNKLVKASLKLGPA